MLRSNLTSLIMVILAFSIGIGLGSLFPPMFPSNVANDRKPEKRYSGGFSTHVKSRPRVAQHFRKEQESDLLWGYKLPPKSSFEKQGSSTESSRALMQPELTRFPALPHTLTRLVSFNSSPFPYEGSVPYTGQPFLNIVDDGRQAHKTHSGRVYWAEETYNDNRVLLHVPKGFDINKPGVIVLFFHGHGATLERDVISRQKVPEQISQAGINAVLVAPQFAFDARDSSAGKFWLYGGAYRFLKETSQKLAEIYGDTSAQKKFDRMPVVIFGYSGGYSPTAWCLAKGGISKRVKGVVLLDGLYGHLSIFANWIRQNRNSVFLSAYTKLTKPRNVKLQEMLTEREVSFKTELDGELAPGNVVFIQSDEHHHHYVTQAWVARPIQDVLARLNGTVPGIQKIRSASF